MSVFVEKVLDILQSGAETSLSLFEALFPFDPYSSAKRLERLGWRGPQRFNTKWSEKYRKQKQFYNLLNYLKRTGLLEKKESKNATFWRITGKGRERLKVFQNRQEDPLSRAHIKFPKPSGEEVIVISFDIPESLRKKRYWLRLCLIEMGFKRIQKSVWVDKGRVSEEFMHALRERDLLEYVHIFSVQKSGTILKISSPK